MKKLHTSLALATLAATSLTRFANDSTVVEPTVSTDASATGGLTVTAVEKPKAEPKPQSKADKSRGIMVSLTEANNALPEGERLDATALYEKIIAEMITVNGYDRQLARGTYKANQPKVADKGVAAPIEGKKPTKKAEAPAASTTEGGAAAPAADAKAE